MEPEPDLAPDEAGQLAEVRPERFVGRWVVVGVVVGVVG
jgi:hypothetical protein